MEHPISLFFQSIFVDNMIFALFLDMCSYLAVFKNVKTSLGLGVTVTFALLIITSANYLLLIKILGLDCFAEGVDLTYLNFTLFIVVVVGIIQTVETVVERFSPSLYGVLGIFLPLIAVNCAIMGVSLFMQRRTSLNPASTQYIGTVWDVPVYDIGPGPGRTLAVVVMGATREKMKYSDVPEPLQGLGITFTTVRLMAVAVMCFSGLKV